MQLKCVVDSTCDITQDKVTFKRLLHKPKCEKLSGVNSRESDRERPAGSNGIECRNGNDSWDRHNN
uniref:Uncharacterized protein n=1 Tax=Heterorhabditis bacteriophora TaxID=37862 RepID=A0A1I7X4T0_HETBA